MENKEFVGVLFSVDNPNYNWESVLKESRGYEFIDCKKIENVTNSKWPKWSIIVNYKRDVR